MKYKVGDKVRVKSLINIQYCINNHPRAFGTVGWVEDMDAYCGTVMTVQHIGNNKYRMAEDHGVWRWIDYMFEDAAVTPISMWPTQVDIKTVKEATDALLAINSASKYNKPITGLDGVKTIVDVYRVLVAFGIIDPELQHSLKKLLNLGTRGKGDYTQDLDEAILSLQKMKERKEQECK